MLKRLRDYESWELRSSDGNDVGKIEDFLFDDETWTVRSLVVQAGSWFADHSVILSPMSIERLDRATDHIELRLTRDQITGAPGLETTQPISREWERDYARYYGFPYYWTGPSAWGPGATPLEARLASAATQSAPRASAEDRHLRSANAVGGYHIHATDGEIGHVEDFLVNDDTWTIRYLLVDTSNWIGGRTVLIAPEWAQRIDWTEQQVHVDVTREAVKASPEYDPGAEIDRQYEERLAEVYRHQTRTIS